MEFKVDKLTVVHVLNNTYSKDQHLMHLIHILVGFFECWCSASHIEGKTNIIAVFNQARTGCTSLVS